MKTLLKYLLILLLAAPIALMPSCRKIDPTIENPGDDPGDDPGDEPGEELPLVEGWAELPVIKDIDGVEYVTHFVSSDGNMSVSETVPGRRRNITIAFDTERHVPLWVAYPMHTWYWSPGNADRKDNYIYDPKVSNDVQPYVTVAAGGSYWQQAPDGAFSRGHMAASADRLRTQTLNDQLFFVTNIVPQNQSFNAGVWGTLENRVRGWSGSATDTLYCVTGVAFEWDKVTYDRRTPRMEIKVPSHFYKVLLQPKTKTNKHVSQLTASELRCIGFWFSNESGTGATISSAAMKVSDIEARVGVEFFPLLSDEAESVKQTLNKGDWEIQ